MSRDDGRLFPSDGRGKRTPDEKRILQRFKRLAPQRDALQLALGPFQDDNGHFDRAKWEQGFNSQEPEDIVRAKAVTGIYEGLVNHLVEMLQVAARMRGLPIAQTESKPSGPDLFAAVKDDGGLTPNKVEVLTQLYLLRNELQHASPSVTADAVYDDVVLLQKTLGSFAQSYVAWLAQHGIHLLPKSK